MEGWEWVGWEVQLARTVVPVEVREVLQGIWEVVKGWGQVMAKAVVWAWAWEVWV